MPEDDRALGVLLLVLALPRVAFALVVHERFGAEVTIAAIAAVLGLVLVGSRRA